MSSTATFLTGFMIGAAAGAGYLLRTPAICRDSGQAQGMWERQTTVTGYYASTTHSEFPPPFQQEPNPTPEGQTKAPNTEATGPSSEASA